MLMQARHPSTSAHVIVIGNEKGGSGKSTVAVHLAVSLLKAGHRVATIDLDCRQQTLTHYIENRRVWRGSSSAPRRFGPLSCRRWIETFCTPVRGLHEIASPAEI